MPAAVRIDVDIGHYYDNHDGNGLVILAEKMRVAVQNVVMSHFDDTMGAVPESAVHAHIADGLGPSWSREDGDLDDPQRLSPWRPVPWSELGSRDDHALGSERMYIDGAKHVVIGVDLS